METYSSDIPALAPLASGTYDSPAAALTNGDPMVAMDIIAASKQKRSRESTSLLHPQHITGEELVAARRRQRLVESAQFGELENANPQGDDHVPAWGQQILDQLQQLQQQIQDQSQQIEVQRLHFEQESQRAMNRSIRTTQESLQPLIRTNDGIYPAADDVWFPGTALELQETRGQRLKNLLHFYDLDATGRAAAQKSRLRRFLGVNL